MVNAINILSLINNNNWDKILKLLKNNKIKPNEIINIGGTIAHIASVNNEHPVLEYYLNNYPNILEKTNDDGDNCYHILAKHMYGNILKKLIKKNKHAVNLVNNDKKTVLHILNVDNNNIFDWIIKNVKESDLDYVDISGNTLLLQSIKQTNSENDKHFNRIELLLERGADINKPTKNPPLCDAILNKKDYVAKYLIKSGADLDIKDKNFFTPLILAVYNKMYDIVNLLIKKGSDINYKGAEGDYNPVSFSIERKDYKMVDIFLDNKFDLNRYDRNMNTPLHTAFSMDRISPTLVAKLVYYGDMNIQNLNGDTPLHILLKKHDWKDYENFLIKKKMDIFLLNKDNKSPIQYIKGRYIESFYDTTTKSYINQTKLLGMIDFDKGKKNSRTSDNKKCMTKECINEVKTHIVKEQISFPKKNDEDYLKDQFKFIIGKYSNYGKFNSDTFHSMIYTLIILSRNKNLCVPFQYFIKDKVITEKMFLDNNNLYRSQEGLIITDLVNIYTNFFYEISPYLILWRDKDKYYINKDLELYTLKSLNSANIRFIFFKLTLISSAKGTHANILIFDKEKSILDRFDPYGSVPYLETDQLDDILEKEIGGFLSKHQKKKITYLRPKDLMKDIGFQIVSDDSNDSVKKLGDPVGYCLAWVFWYLEMRIKNPDMHPTEIINKSFKKIINSDSKDRKELFIDYIRNYATDLDTLKNKFMIEAGISEEKIYNLVLDKSDYKKIINKMIEWFNKIIIERL